MCVCIYMYDKRRRRDDAIKESKRNMNSNKKEFMRMLLADSQVPRKRTCLTSEVTRSNPSLETNICENQENQISSIGM